MLGSSAAIAEGGGGVPGSRTEAGARPLLKNSKPLDVACKLKLGPPFEVESKT